MGEVRIVGPGKTRGYPYPICKKCCSISLSSERPFVGPCGLKFRSLTYVFIDRFSSNKANAMILGMYHCALLMDNYLYFPTVLLHLSVFLVS